MSFDKRIDKKNGTYIQRNLAQTFKKKVTGKWVKIKKNKQKFLSEVTKTQKDNYGLYLPLSECQLFGK